VKKSKNLYGFYRTELASSTQNHKKIIEKRHHPIGTSKMKIKNKNFEKKEPRKQNLQA
jgi:hypothetical protein